MNGLSEILIFICAFLLFLVIVRFIDDRFKQKLYAGGLITLVPKTYQYTCLVDGCSYKFDDEEIWVLEFKAKSHAQRHNRSWLR